MPTELNKQIVRKTKSGLVFLADEDGVAVRLPHKKKWLRATWDQVVKAGLQNAGAKLNADEWFNPMELLVKTTAVLKRGRKPKRKESEQCSSSPEKRTKSSASETTSP